VRNDEQPALLQKCRLLDIGAHQSSDPDQRSSTEEDR
jgi:hypothetical protein